MNSQYIGAAGGNAPDSVNYGTLLHEIGHAIGLKHPTEDVVDNAAEPSPVDHDQVLASDDPTLTIMSEMEDTSPGAGAAHLKALDMEAAAYLYGPAGTGGVYTYDDTGTITQWSWDSATETPSSTVLGPVVSGANSVSQWSWDPATQTLTQIAVATDEAVHGTSVNDDIIGMPGDELFALDGNDTLQGAGGNDKLYGGPGTDLLIGGAGGNTFYINSTTTTVDDSLGSGDTAYSSVSFALPENVDTLYVYGEGVTGTANNQNDTLFGDGTNGTVLIGGAGDDYMVGSSANNTFEPGTGPDLMFGRGSENDFVFRSAADAPIGSTLTTIGDFIQGSDKIDLSAITGSGGQPLTFIGTNLFSGHPGEVRQVTSGSNTIVEGDLNGDGTPDFEIELYGNFTLQADDFVLSSTACYCAGTRIRTDDGERPIEELAVGDLVMTVSGEAKPIKWIGRRSYGGRFIVGNRSVLPIRIEAGAIAAGVPARDLRVSPAHALYLEGVLVPAQLVVNGATITQPEQSEEVTYFHLEFESHEIIFAEGMTAESYVDCGNRLMFENAREFAATWPDDGRAPPQFCAARLDEGATELPVIRAALLARAETLGYETDGDPDLHLIVDGAAVRAASVGGGVYRFSVPAGSVAVSLASRSVAPADVDANSRDFRRLGVPVERIVLRDNSISIEVRHGHAELANGFHEDGTAFPSPCPDLIRASTSSYTAVPIKTWPPGPSPPMPRGAGPSRKTPQPGIACRRRS